MAVTVLGNIKESKHGKASQHLSNSIKYVLNPDKTEDCLWMGSNCGSTATEIYDAMMNTKREFQKLQGRQGYHFVISFRPGECNEAKAYDVIKEFCETYLPGYDYVFAIHNDQEHMHGHIVFNSVGRIDGNKYRYVNGDWEKYIQPITDKICEKHGLEKLTYDKSKNRKGKSYAEHAAEKSGKFSCKEIIPLDIDRAVSVSDSFDDYIEEMQRIGYKIRIGNSEKYGQYIAYQHGAMEICEKKSERARRDYRLGAGYTMQDIQQRILLEKGNVPADKIYVSEKLHIINEYRKNSRFIVCSAMRYNQAQQFHYYNMNLSEQIRVRKDLLRIDSIRNECNYLIDNNIGSIQQAQEKLENVRKEIREIKAAMKTQEAADEIFTPKENEIRNTYRSLVQKLQNEGCKMSDEEFEELVDIIEEYEENYSEAGLTDLSAKENVKLKEKLSAVMQEKRTLMHIIKDSEETMKVRELSKVIDKYEDKKKIVQNDNKMEVRR